jgi:hypothetical protein
MWLLEDITSIKVESLLLKTAEDEHSVHNCLNKILILYGPSKHMDTKFYFICDCVKNGMIYVDHVSTWTFRRSHLDAHGSLKFVARLTSSRSNKPRQAYVRLWPDF